MLFGANGRAIRAHAPTLVVARSRLTERGHAMALAYHPLFPFLSTHELRVQSEFPRELQKQGLSRFVPSPDH